MKNIIKYPNQVLLAKAEAVLSGEDVNETIDEMIQVLMLSNGVGLAAPQIGVSKRIIVMKLTADQITIIVNPQIAESSGEQRTKEGCLSFPGAFISLTRAEKIKVTGLNRKGEEVSLDLEGQKAVIVQHEVDHLDGKTIMQRADILQRKKIKSMMLQKERYDSRKQKAAVRKPSKSSRTRRSSRKR